MADFTDCLVIGGGPAGLLAAIYLARFRRSVIVIDAGQSRARLIPTSHNIPGYIHGVSGKDLLRQLAEQAAQLNIPIREGSVARLTPCDGGFQAHCDTMLTARKVVLATGIVDLHPPYDNWRDAIRRGVLRYCPVCDGYEAQGATIAVVGPLKSAAAKAIFLRNYSPTVTLVPSDDERPAETLEKLASAGVLVATTKAARLEDADQGAIIIHADGATSRFDLIYPAMGAEVRSDLAVALGARHAAGGFLVVDDKQRTSVNGLYGIGDVVTDLHQISVAYGHAAVAACHIHNALPRRLEAHAERRLTPA